MSEIPDVYREAIAPLIGSARDIVEAGETLVTIAFVGNLARRALQVVAIDPVATRPKDEMVETIRATAVAQEADFIFTVMDAWALAPDQAHRYDEIIARYGSIGDSPYRIDIVNFSLETYQGTWMAQTQIEAPEGGPRTFGEPAFRRYPRMAGRFVALLPGKNPGTEAPPVLH